MKYLFSLLSLLCLSVLYVTAQPRCGTVFTREHIAALREVPLGEIPIDPATYKPTTTDVRVQFHVVCSGAATTASITDAQISSALSYVNTKFADAGLNFVQCSAVNFIEYSPLAANFTTTEIDQLKIGVNDRTTAINVYFHNQIEYGDYEGL